MFECTESELYLKISFENRTNENNYRNKGLCFVCVSNINLSDRKRSLGNLLLFIILSFWSVFRLSFNSLLYCHCRRVCVRFFVSLKTDCALCRTQRRRCNDLLGFLLNLSYLNTFKASDRLLRESVPCT